MTTTHPLANLRDLGGTTVAGGILRPGALFRSDDVALIGEDDARGLVDAGVTLVIDLRSAREVSALGRGPLAALPVDHLPAPLSSGDSQPSASLIARFASTDDPASAMGEWYADLLRDRAAQVVTALAAIAANPGGTLFHCSAGKDRTGILAATVLALLGTKECDIVTDYARTEAALDAVNLRLAGRHPAQAAATAWHRLPAVLTRAPREAMVAMLADVRDRDGSIRGLLTPAGYNEAAHAALHARLVETP